MIHDIGESAGRIWQYLSENSPAALEQMNTSLKLKESLFYMAIGWLAREDKLTFEEAGKTMKLSLK